jgi:hypothetical protein
LQAVIDVENDNLLVLTLKRINKIYKVSTKSEKRARREKCNIICLKW